MNQPTDPRSPPVVGPPDGDAPGPPRGFEIGLDGRGGVSLVYILYVAGFFFQPAALAGVVLAYVNRGRNAAWIDGHYTFQIRTFWIGLLTLALGGITALILVGYLVMLVWLIWTLVRIITGMQKLMRGEAVADPEGWGFSA